LVHRYQKPDYQALRYHSAPKKKKTVGSLDEIDPEMRAAWDKLGIPIGEQVLVPAHGVLHTWGLDMSNTRCTGSLWVRLCTGPH
jgi:hypothetical protein